jgi:AcrR family transcriptional regulator
MTDTHGRSTLKASHRPRIEGERENEILDATLALLASVGYDRLTLDAVATEARASKATLYRRWETKAELVVDAIARAKGGPHPTVVDSGSLRGDLIAMACTKGGFNDSNTLKVVSSVITALQLDQEFSDAFHERFLEPMVTRTRLVYERAKRRGEIPDDVDLDLLTPVLGAIILHRAFVLRLSVDDETVERIIDEVVLPAATRCASLEPTGDRKRSQT